MSIKELVTIFKIFSKFFISIFLRVCLLGHAICNYIRSLDNDTSHMVHIKTTVCFEGSPTMLFNNGKFGNNGHSDHEWRWCNVCDAMFNSYVRKYAKLYT